MRSKVNKSMSMRSKGVYVARGIKVGGDWMSAVWMSGYILVGKELRSSASGGASNGDWKTEREM